MKRPIALVILDGFGYRDDKRHNAIAAAHMRHFNSWLLEYPHALIYAAGESVGLPAHMPGNSLVGHLTLGAGRIVPQAITVLNQQLADGSFFKNQTLINRFRELKRSGGTLHLMGLLSDGANHSSDEHLYALLRMAHQQGIAKIMVHVFLDGRDVGPRSAAHYLKKLDVVFQEIGCGELGSMHGRAYAMDRAERLEYLQKSYDVLTQSHASQFKNWQEALEYYYSQGISDEFIPPTTLIAHSCMKPGDGLIFFNIRADRARGLMHLFFDSDLSPSHPEQSRRILWIVTGVRYSAVFPCDILYDAPIVEHTLLDVLEDAQKTTFVIAESEKYAHVSYFFNGGRELVHPHEARMIIPSIPPEKFVQHPEMSAPEITDAVIRSLTKNPRDFYLINYANPDMVGHTGDFDATVKAVRCIDIQLDRLYVQIVEKMGGTMYIVADHGKAEDMYDEKANQPRTAHTTNPVYFLMMQKDIKHKPHLLSLYELSEIAPFILKQMHLPIPQEMQPLPETSQKIY